MERERTESDEKRKILQVTMITERKKKFRRKIDAKKVAAHSSKQNEIFYAFDSVNEWASIICDCIKHDAIICFHLKFIHLKGDCHAAPEQTENVTAEYISWQLWHIENRTKDRGNDRGNVLMETFESLWRLLNDARMTPATQCNNKNCNKIATHTHYTDTIAHK